MDEKRNLSDSTVEAQDSMTDQEIVRHGLRSLTAKQWWLLAAGFIVFFNTWGLLLSFGAFQSYYEETLLVQYSSSEISWIATLCSFLLLIGGLVTGQLFDAGYLKVLLLGGSLLQVFGIMMLSLSKEYYQLLLSQGLCVGIGGSVLYVPVLAAVATAFGDSARPKATGFIAAGSALGGIIYPIMFRRLVSSVGFGWTVRAIGFIALGMYLISYGVLLDKSPKSASLRRWIDFSAFTDGPFVSVLISGVFAGIGYYLPLLYIPQFAQTSIPGLSPDLAFYLISIINAFSAVGRISAGALAARVGVIELFAMSFIGCAVVLLCWIAVDSVAGIIVWCVAWGLVSSVIVSMPGAAVPLLCPSPSVIGTRLGMWWASAGVGVLVGGPIGGALLSSDAGTLVWWHVQVFVGLMMAACAFIWLWLVISFRRRTKG